MDEQPVKDAAEEINEEQLNQVRIEGLSRKEKRKAMKKVKRKLIRKEIAVKEKEVEEAKLNDPEEERKLKAIEEEEAQRRERELKKFEESERAWIQAMELKKKKEEEEEQEEEENRRKVLEESHGHDVDKKNEYDENEEWDYVEEGPAEIIFQGNEIIVRKKKVRVKKQTNQLCGKEDVDRPTSNPLPPQSEAFSDHQNASSAQQMLESVAQQVPNFGTEQDKAHCPFHLKTAACRFGQRCSRVHFYPDKSCTLLIKNMYNGPGLSWEQDEGLEHNSFLEAYTDEEVEKCYEEFYEDVHTEFLKFGELVNFKVCRNGSFHLRGNVYVHYKSLESAVLAYHSINGRYFAGKQIRCEFVNVHKWKVAICGEYMKSRLKICSHGMACNFIHCFRNPSGDYEWADCDKAPPKYWVKKMTALFGYLDEYDKLMEQEQPREWKGSSKIGDSYSRKHSKRSRSRSSDVYNLNHGSDRIYNSDSDDLQSIDEQRRISYKDYRRKERRSRGGDVDQDQDRDKDRDIRRIKKRSRERRQGSESLTKKGDTKKRNDESDFNYFSSDSDGESYHSYTKNSRGIKRRCSPNNKDTEYNKAGGDRYDRRREQETLHGHLESGSRHQTMVGSPADQRSSKKRNHYTDTLGKRPDKDQDETKHRPRKTKNVGHHAKGFESPDHQGDAGYVFSDTDKMVDKDRERHDHHHTSKSSRHTSEVTDLGGREESARCSKGNSDQGVSTHRKSKKKDHSRMAVCETKSRAEGLSKSLDGYEADSSKSHDGDSLRAKAKQNIDTEGYLEPSYHENDHNRVRKTTAESSKSDSPGRYDGRNHLSDLNSGYYNDEIVR